jgi:hypothetical protein
MACGCGKSTTASGQASTGLFKVTINGVERAFLTAVEAEAAAKGAGLDPTQAVTR